MKIKVKLKISILFYLVTTLAVIILTLMTLHQSNNASVNLKAANKISKGVFELNILTSDFLIHHHWTRPKIQWRSKHEALKKLLLKLHFRVPEEQTLLSTITGRHQKIKSYFYQLVANYEGHKFDSIFTHKDALGQRLINLLLVESQEMVSESYRLASMSHARLLFIQRRTNLFLILLVVLLGAVVAINSVLILRSILKPLSKFKEGTEIVGSGNLDFRVGSEADDEVGQLTRAFDLMVTNLKTTLASRDELELRVKERTSDLALTNEKLKTSLHEKDLLLSEIHHRVKNNMQIVSSLLSLESRQIEDEKASEQFVVCKNRIQSMAQVHEYLYHSEDLSSLNVKEYLNKLVSDLCKSNVISQDNISTVLNIEEVNFGIDMAIPFGLIITELVTNALKHAFTNSKKGVIKIDLNKINEDDYSLTVKDNGIGFTDSIDIKNSSTLGLKLVDALVKKLKGNLNISGKKGTVVKITFPVHKIREHI